MLTKQMTKWQIEEWIRDYKFMLREINRLNRLLNRISFGGSMVAQYGIEATLPHGSSGISQAKLKQVDRREQRLMKYEDITSFLNIVAAYIETDKYRIVYECMLDGMSYRAIAKHLGYQEIRSGRSKNRFLRSSSKKAKKSTFRTC